ncbi:MAG TPA: hypothetical protein PKD55_24995, partial [Bellilinea sp.]|nr:hypothetical protein [Bellilinea sp.]
TAAPIVDNPAVWAKQEGRREKNHRLLAVAALPIHIAAVWANNMFLRNNIFEALHDLAARCAPLVR